MPDSLLAKTQAILDQLQNGQFVEGMEEFYADDAVNEEPDGTRVVGKAAIIANEHEVLANVAKFHGITVHAIGAGADDGNGNGVTFAEYSIRVDMKDGSTFNPDQVQVIRWEDGKAKRLTFYYNPQFQAG